MGRLGARSTSPEARNVCQTTPATSASALRSLRGPCNSCRGVPVLQQLIKIGLPMFGICLGHQILALSLGARTKKMHQGHRGANHPVQHIGTGTVEITSQNHGFVVVGDSLPQGVQATHLSLFDQTLEGLAVEGRPIFSVQYHPEASPGPQDSNYLFERFTALMGGA